MDHMQYILYVMVMALVTYLIRMLPLAIFTRKINSRFVKSFLYYVPYAVLGAMTFPAILYSTNSMVSATVGFAVAIALAYWEKSLLTVALFACGAVLVVEWIMLMV